MNKVIWLNIKNTYPVFALVLFTIQFGSSEFISVQFISFFLLSYHAIATGRFTKINVVVFFVLLSFIFALGITLDDHDLHRTLVCIRTVFCASVAYSYSIGERSSFSPRHTSRIIKSLRLFSFVCVVLSLLQLLDTFFFKTGYFYIPLSWYSLDYGTISSANKFDVLFLRPSGPFSEPSVLAANGVMIYCISILFKDLRLTFLGLLMTFISISLTGYIFIFFSTFFFVFNQIGFFENRRIRLITIFSTFIFLTISFFVFNNRISNILAGSDLSSLIRIFEPLQVISLNFKDGFYLGTTDLSLQSHLGKVVTTIFDNWFFNQFLLFGLLAPFIFIILFVFYPFASIPLILLFGFSNGDIFYYDRVVMFIVFFHCIRLNCSKLNTSNFLRNP